MKLFIIIFALVSILFECANCTVGGVGRYLGCYWRLYNGEVPQDAVPGGQDSWKGTTYIGQGLVYFNGFEQLIYAEVPLTLYQGNITAVAPIGYPTVVAPYPKILCCSLESSYKWIHTTASTFLSDVVNELPIIGGVQAHVNNSKWIDTLYIGRSTIGEDVVTGKILLHNNVISFYYVKDNNIGELSSFQVLVHRI